MASRVDRNEVLRQLRAARPSVVPSLLLCDFGNLEREVGQLEAADVVALHLDVMDGHFAPNLTYGMLIVEAIRSRTALPLDVHLMIENPERYVESFYNAGASVITVHTESVDDPQPVLEKIRTLGAVAGLAIDLPTSLAGIAESLPYCDLVLVMSVPIGFGGQQFDKRALEKLRHLRAEGGADLLLEVDGGINHDTIRTCAEAGADLFSVGATIFSSDDYSATVRDLTHQADAGSKLCSQRCS